MIEHCDPTEGCRKRSRRIAWQGKATAKGGELLGHVWGGDEAEHTGAQQEEGGGRADYLV